MATLDVLEQDSGVEAMHVWGQQLWDGIQQQARERGLPINLTGHVTMPYLTFPGDEDYERGELFAAVCAREGLYVHPRHNWFVSTALTQQDLATALTAIGRAFDAVAEYAHVAERDG
jgi:glutamate-1-semialdehyde 2,1-aminomutase